MTRSRAEAPTRDCGSPVWVSVPDVPMTRAGQVKTALLVCRAGVGACPELLMLTRSLLFRIAGPTLFVSLLFLGSCITAAVYLHHRQSASLRALDENLWSRRLAGGSPEGPGSLPGGSPAVDEALHAASASCSSRPGGSRISRKSPGSWVGWRRDSRRYPGCGGQTRRRKP